MKLYKYTVFFMHGRYKKTYDDIEAETTYDAVCKVCDMARKDFPRLRKIDTQDMSAYLQNVTHDPSVLPGS
jgi:hypothetical protein